ncbi:MAG TPA: response regulator transcription factor [Acidimicrobiales bacterium]|nr:response regulator transcription factor [Acidimicrobiales bacterium]
MAIVGVTVAQADGAAGVKTTVLVVDDDDDLRVLLGLVLRGEGHRVVEVADAAAATAALAEGGIDLVVLDVSLGDGDGRVLLSRIRSEGELPVVMISGRGETDDRVLGLRLGADDFLAKPFSPVELAARVASVLRRSARQPVAVAAQAADAAPPVAADPAGLRIDERTREVSVDGRPVELTAREFDLLAFLAASPRQVFSRGQLLEHVWASRSEWQDEATVTEHIRRVRRKVEADPEQPRYILTVRGVGYRFQP